MGLTRDQKEFIRQILQSKSRRVVLIQDRAVGRTAARKAANALLEKLRLLNEHR